MSFIFSTQYEGRACQSKSHDKSNWTAINTAIVVLGFIIWWPIGLFLLFWVESGRHIEQLLAAIGGCRSKIKSFKSKYVDDMESDNVIFNEYQKTQYDRITEIKDEIRARSQRFRDFRDDVKRREDEEEFNRFMASSPLRNES